MKRRKITDEMVMRAQDAHFTACCKGRQLTAMREALDAALNPQRGITVTHEMIDAGIEADAMGTGGNVQRVQKVYRAMRALEPTAEKDKIKGPIQHIDAQNNLWNRMRELADASLPEWTWCHACVRWYGPEYSHARDPSYKIKRRSPTCPTEKP